MHCPNCGNIIPDDAMFCPFCGTKITPETTVKKDPFSFDTPAQPSFSTQPSQPYQPSYAPVAGAYGPMASKPWGITFAKVYFGITSFWYVLTGIIYIYVINNLYSYSNYNGIPGMPSMLPASSSFRQIIVYIAIIYFSISLLSLVSFFGVIKETNWSRVVAIITYVVIIIVSLFGLFGILAIVGLYGIAFDKKASAYYASLKQNEMY